MSFCQEELQDVFKDMQKKNLVRRKVSSHDSRSLVETLKSFSIGQSNEDRFMGRAEIEYLNEIFHNNGIPHSG